MGIEGGIVDKLSADERSVCKNIFFEVDDIKIKEVDFEGKDKNIFSYDKEFYTLYPIVYVLNDNKKIYVGETSNVARRFAQHNIHEEKRYLKNRHVIYSHIFNKSVTLHLENFLINCFSADNQLKLVNSNLGVGSVSYYQRNLYENLFPKIWEKLVEKKLAKSSYDIVNSSDIFKYSPYKSLLPEQQQAVLDTIQAWVDGKKGVVIHGAAGTGKTIVAIYIIKLLTTPSKYFDNVSDSDDFIKQALDLVMQFRKKFHIAEVNGKVLEDEIAIVISMTSLRLTLKKVFKSIEGLSPSMIISPTDLSKKRYRFVIVDESHRLKRRINISNMGLFGKVNTKLGFDLEEGNELNWILKQSDHQVFFYDSKQRIKKTDIPHVTFFQLLPENQYSSIVLKTQIRSKGGNLFTEFVERLFDCNLDKNEKFESDYFELKLYEKFSEMQSKIKELDKKYSLCRLVAGYSWVWKSKKNKSVKDIYIDDCALSWNSTNKDWIHSSHAIDEVGCIHTTQGYDLNYVGVILGKEIDYDPILNCIVIYKNEYHDINGKKATEESDLLEYIKNIYRTLIFRGVRGVYIYCCNKNLNEYLKKHMDIIE